MPFVDIIGQKRPTDILQKALSMNRVAHAYLFHGPDGVGKEALAIEFAKALLCKDSEKRPCHQCTSCHRVKNFIHPDFIYIFPTPKTATVENEREILNSLAEDAYIRLKPWASPTISIERIRELRRTIRLKPLEGKRVVIIAEADKMTAEAANALLKILEEPPAHMHLILSSSRVNTLLPTIVSRCQEIRFGLLSDDEVQQALVLRKKLEPEQARVLARMSQGNYYRAVEWLEQNIGERRDLVIDLLRCCFRDSMSQVQFIEDMLKNFDKNIVKDFLTLAQIWFRDAMICSVSLQRKEDISSRIVNFDKLDTLIKFVGAFDEIDYDKVMQETERAIELIDRNVQLNLIFLVLLFRLQSILKRKGRA
jgi:DNA polymerase III subunit delta'